MKRRLFLTLGVALTLLASTEVEGQESGSSVKLTGRVSEKGSIMLRWAPDSPVLWQLGNSYGYTVERFTITRDNNVVPSPQRSILTLQPIKPARQELWESVMDGDDYVAVAAQAIFGETFELEQTQTEILQVINKARELESRFSLALFSADQSAKAAELSGLYYKDEKVAPGERYLYRVFANVPLHIHKADTGYFLAGLADYKPLPPPEDLHADFQDRLVMLSWNGAAHEQTYNSYRVERSDDGGRTFIPISADPVVNAFNGDHPHTRLIFKSDSLPSNDAVYHYRVIGINAFGETGPPSDTVSGTGRPVFGYSASVDDHVVNADGSVTLNYSFPIEGVNLLQSFDLLRVDPKTKASETLKSGLGADLRTVHDPMPRSSNYYVIAARDRYGRSNRSFPYLVQLEDSIPPSAPHGLTGRIDTLGHVYLAWKSNAEDDILGYAIYRANFMSEEFIQVKGAIQAKCTYVDTIELDNLTEKIYYKVTAVDRRFNYSPFSELLELRKPDLIAPSPPVFAGIRNDSLGIALRWIPSGSDDVVQHLLYRRAEGEEEWTLIRMVEAADTVCAFTDVDINHRIEYAYTILAVDDAGLESIPASPVSIRRIDANRYPEITQVFSKVDHEKRSVTIAWRYDYPDVDKYLIYRATNGGPMALYKSVTSQEFVDSYGVSDQSREYRIVAGFRSGERSKSSPPLIIKL